MITSGLGAILANVRVVWTRVSTRMVSLLVGAALMDPVIMTKATATIATVYQAAALRSTRPRTTLQRRHHLSK